MSSRALKKVFGEDDLKKIDPNSEDESPIVFNNPKKNVYSLLNDCSESAKESEEQEQGNDGKSGDSEDPASQSQSGPSKKKKKRKKAKNKKKQPTDSSEFTTEDETAIRQRQVNAHQHQHQQHKVKKEIKEEQIVSNKFDEIFKIDSRYLNPEFEMKKIFGSRALNYESGKRGKKRVYKYNKLIAPQNRWPPVVRSGISMSYMNTTSGAMYFKYEHNDEYRRVQRKFMKCVDSLDPDNIVGLLREHTYHIDSHIQLSDMAKSAEDMQVATELIEGALYCLENLFHVRFNITLSNCRLPYIFQENRAFFILLFKHLVFVGQRACSRTALELSKRLLTLDPDNDPLCVLLMIDFYAVKSEEYQWLIDLYNFWENQRNLSQLPNWAYSVALAYHLLSVKNGDDKLAEKSDTLIKYAMLMFPSVFLPLIEKCNIVLSSREKNHPYFNRAEESTSRGLKLLCELYVWRSHHVFKENSVLGWLEKNVSQILNQVDAKDPIIKDFEEKRNRRYKGSTPLNILRHVLLVDVKELHTRLPKDIGDEPILNYDPLPPKESVNIYNVKRVRGQGSSNSQRGGILSMLFRSLIFDLNQPTNPWQFQLEDDPDEGDPEPRIRIRALANPNYAHQAQAQVNQQQPAGHQVQGAEGGQVVVEGADGIENPLRGLGQSVTTLLDAMRDLLNVTTANHQANEAEEDADTEDEEETETDDNDIDDMPDLVGD